MNLQKPHQGHIGDFAVVKHSRPIVQAVFRNPIWFAALEGPAYPYTFSA